MNKVAKAVIIDNDDKYLLMYRSAHPVFGDDADLPGGTLEEGEEPLEAMIREVYEESGIALTESQVSEVYAGTDYSTHGTYYSLFTAKLDYRPDLIMSWEHSSYEWLEREEFLARARGAKDTYMHMVHDTL